VAQHDLLSPKNVDVFLDPFALYDLAHADTRLDRGNSLKFRIKSDVLCFRRVGL
jgi:hypothetical protein